MNATARVTLLLAAVSLLAPGAQAQYFGRNAVQYQNFQFKILKTQHFDIYYYDKEAGAATEAGRMAERGYTRISQVLRHQLSGGQAATSSFLAGPKSVTFGVPSAASSTLAGFRSRWTTPA